MQSQTDYRRDIVTEVVGYFRRRTDEMLAAGIRRENIILDPGFGFAKTTEQNYELLAGLHRLCALGYPVLAGLSRKSMIYKVLDATPAESLAGTVALLGVACARVRRYSAVMQCAGSCGHGQTVQYVPPMIRATDIHKSFGTLEVLKGVSLDVAQGEVVSIVGGQRRWQ